jgi:hypothetical protein
MDNSFWFVAVGCGDFNLFGFAFAECIKDREFLIETFFR